MAKTGPTKAKNLLGGDVLTQGTVVTCTAVCKVVLNTGRVLYLEHEDVVEVIDYDKAVPQHPTEEVEHEQEAQHEAPAGHVGVQDEGPAAGDESPERSDAVGRAQGLGQAMKGLIPGL